MELEHLKRLREVNQDLLHRLRMMQEEMRKRLSSKPLFPASLPDRTATERSVPLPTGEKADQVDAGNSTADPAVLVSVEPGAYAARAALCSSLKRSSNNRGFQERQVKMQEAVGLDSSFPDKDKNVMSVSAITDAGHVPLQSDPEEYNVPVSSWSARPFLGYDWIAGLLETETSVAERSDQYFAELHEFRQANKEACVHEQHLEPKALDHIVPEQEPDLITSSHKCVYCYRLNQRLFTVPVDSESACPVCKIPRAHQPPEEPAHVRVSIPRSTLLPAYKYKAHRRKSFELADNLALPSHCLAGWKNIIPSSNPKLSSLDLRASLKEKPSHHACLVKEFSDTAPACPS
ncbi:migration and invasion-inhibitory protein [Phaenicophaeus curvirostris]|uniref:migration and invasion-inhibitory protein n=1 Tax=Phaenicophaeus curvirostris TaxID=33595 RepID=UPI0037F0BEDB